MMSSLSRFPVRRLGALAGLLALMSLAVGLPARAADEPDAGGTFTSPGYPQRNVPQGGNAGTQPGATIGNPATQIGGRPNGNGSNANNGTSPRNGRDPNDAFPRRSEPAPLPKPNEFQRFVEGATGRLLPIFGSTFFADAADNFQSLDNVPVSADYTIGPGDEIVTRAWGSIDVDYRSSVDRNGMLNLPKVGSFNVAGVKAADLEKNLRAQIGRLFTNFNLSVSLGQLRGLRIFVVGPAQRPGVVTLSSQSTMLSAVVAAGGPSPAGSMRKILLRRDDKVISELDVYEFLVQGDKSKDVQLVAGDVVVFQPAGPRVALTGSIDTPAIYELKSAQEPIRDVLRYAGGAPVLANPNRVQLERIDPAQPLATRFVETFRLDAAGQQKTLRDGDVVTLLAISPQFANAVTLKGHVAQPLRYPFTPGMRIRDLIPDRDALITPDFYRRKNLLVQVIEDEDRMRLRDESDRASDSATRGGRSTSDFAQGTGGSADARNDARSDNRSDGRSDRRGDSRDGIDRQGSDRAGNDRTTTDSARSNRGSIREDDRAAAVRARRTPAALFDELNWDYATIERLTPDLSTQVIAFNLGKAVLQGDEANNIALAPGDVVTVYSQKDVRVPVARQTRLVSLEGEVNAPGIYQLQAGETLKGLIARAGGFTPQAYVYGLDLSREETRVRQRENLATAMSRLEALSATQAARDAANRRDDPTGAASTTIVSNAATQAQLARLSRIQPNGRIALELTPEIRSIDALPDLPLEHGDRISVPPRPGFVTVAGAVVNSNAFVWKPGRTAGDYLRLAGADEAADTANMFILRADGTVNSAVDRRGFFGRGGLESQVLQPGDALVVPNQLDFETWGRALVRNLKDFAQIISGFGIGIAAIHAINN
ncbi:MAG TPA: SLBB domain-containing protein [Caldimonas sp.]|jgi:protein involved in polysaccharide export with SLBB domain|nr:SLBB domain-containing protein [Caldimonas sp.]